MNVCPRYRYVRIGTLGQTVSDVESYVCPPKQEVRPQLLNEKGPVPVEVNDSLVVNELSFSIRMFPNVVE